MESKYVQLCGYHNHPMARKNGVILEHRLVLSNVLGRYLEPHEVVHHIDGNTKNNAPENLELQTKYTHPTVHARGRKVMTLTCDCCGKNFERELRNIVTKVNQGQKHFYCSRSCHYESLRKQ